MPFTLQSLTHRRNGQYVIWFTSPDGKTEEETYRLGELRALANFWGDRGGSASLHNSGTGDAEPAALSQFAKTAAAAQRKRARVEFLLNRFPAWPATIEDLMAFQIRTGNLAPDIEALSPHDAWEALFDEAPPTPIKRPSKEHADAR